MLAQVFNDLYARRQESDYLDFVQLEADQVQSWIAGAEQLVEHVASLLEGMANNLDNEHAGDTG